MNCFRCIIEGLKFGGKLAVTVYKGTALCARHAVDVELEEQRETMIKNVRGAQPKKAQ